MGAVADQIMTSMFTNTDITNHFHALAAAQNGWLDDLKSMITENLFKPISGHISAAVNNNLLAVAAAANGQLDVIKWMVQKSGQPLDLLAQHNRTLHFAIESGNLELVRWMILESGQPFNVLEDERIAERIADKRGYPEISKFLSTVADLNSLGVSITRLQSIPKIVDAVQSGKMRIEYAEWLSDEDFEHLVGSTQRVIETRKILS